MTNQYKTIKAANPHLPVRIRESSNVPPSLIVRFEKGVEVKKELDTLSEDEIAKVLSNV